MASQSFIEPDSSASTCPKLIHRKDSAGSTVATAPNTNGKRLRKPVWKSRGSSPVMRYCLNATGMARPW